MRDGFMCLSYNWAEHLKSIALSPLSLTGIKAFFDIFVNI
ncbi:SSU ribosomal protein S9P [Erwinia sp. Ejp617]|nr:SSU ribosomal protein S9P [Erwinia sp. Ejp617]